MSRERPFLSHFSPQWTDPKYLEDILVQRGDLLAESVAVVRDCVLTDQRHHLLFIGPRGAGKTHLVTLIQHRLSQDAALKNRMRVAWLNEDETATSFLRLLIAIYRSLSERYPEEFSADTISKLAGKDPGAAVEQLTGNLLRDLHGRIIVCLMENLDSLFRSLSVAEQRNWRAFLQNHPVIVTVGTAQALFDGIADQDEPFYGFFDTRHLKPLSADEARDLLERVAVLHGRTDLADFLRTPTGRARVDAIRALAGGNPRLYLIFSDWLVNAAALDDLVRPFEEMVDRQLTSYYQERLRWLSPQQREIVQFLCRASSPVSVKHIADGLFTSTNSITGQLRQLRDFRYVDSHPLGREALYELAEPLMRLALQVKETHDRRPLALIVDFLRIWHEQQELADRLASSPSDSPARAYLENANRLMLTAPNLRHELFRRDLDLAGPEQCDDIALEKARTVANSGEAADLIRLGLILNARKEWEEAIRIFTVLIEGDKAHSVDQIAWAFVSRGVAQGYSGKISEVIPDHTPAIELPGVPPEVFAELLSNRASCHANLAQHEAVLRDLGQLFMLLDERASREILSPGLYKEAREVVTSVFAGTTDPARWVQLLTQFTGHFARFGGLTGLGEAAVQHLPDIGTSPLNHAAWDAWSNAWESARAALPPEHRDQLDIPLRLLRAGIAWLKSKDDAHLLTLPREERRILREALELPAEKI
jgi:tetratricopeptide (TPR) repeat protein